MANGSCDEEDLFELRRDILSVIDAVGGNSQSQRSDGRNCRLGGRSVGLTPGMDSIWAHQRPSSSCPSTMGIDLGEGVSIGGALRGHIIVVGQHSDPTIS
jgi:hypothetical protein